MRCCNLVDNILKGHVHMPRPAFGLLLRYGRHLATGQDPRCLRVSPSRSARKACSCGIWDEQPRLLPFQLLLLCAARFLGSDCTWVVVMRDATAKTTYVQSKDTIAELTTLTMTLQGTNVKEPC